MSKSKPAILITCEHAGCEVPEAYSGLIKIPNDVLMSHRGYDIGAYEIADILKSHPGISFVLMGKISRLVIDLNRSLNHKNLWSEWSKHLDNSQKMVIYNEYYKPFREATAHFIDSQIKGLVLHISVHSFTPVFQGRTRLCDLGILYDPNSPGEKKYANHLQKLMRTIAPELIVRKNYPYKGISDGHVTALRKRFRYNYCGIELEWNQNYLSQHMEKVLNYMNVWLDSI